MGALAISSEASAADTTRFTLPIVNLDNPCTVDPDGINGSIDVNAVGQLSNGTAFIKLNAKGSGEDINGLNYQLHGNLNFQVHKDLLPLTFYVKLQAVSQTAVDNFELEAAIKVNEQGAVTKFDFGGVECKG